MAGTDTAPVNNPKQRQFGAPADTCELVLFRIGADKRRPLLVLDRVGRAVSGWLFCNPNEDGAEEWITKHCFYRPTVTAPLVWVDKVSPGSEIGQYTRRDKELGQCKQK